MSELIHSGYHLAGTLGIRFTHTTAGARWLTTASLATCATLIAIATVSPLLGVPRTPQLSEMWALALSITISMTGAMGASIRAWRRFGTAPARLDAVYAPGASGSIGH